jgi:hypothetical protein
VTHDEIVDEVRAAAGIDVDNAATRISRWLNNLIREMAAASGWVRAFVELGPTVEGQAAYPIPSNVVKIRELRVGEGLPLEQEGVRTAWDLQGGALEAGTRDVFSVSFDGTGVRQFRLEETPQTSDDPITGYCELYPAAISADESPVFPDEFHDALVEGCIAIGLSRGDEQNADAQYHRDIYAEAKERLRRLANSQLSSGSARAKVAGYDF